MKKTLITLMALAGVATAEPLTLELTALNSPGTLIGGSSNSAAVTTEAFDNTTDFTTLTGLFTESDKWYVSQGYNNDIGTGDVSSSTDGAVLVVGGPGTARSAIGGIEFSLTSTQLSQFDGAIDFTFNVSRHGGNNKKNHEITFYLLTDSVTLTSSTYNTSTGDNLLTADSSYVSLTFNAEQVAAMQATGEDQTFVFVAYSNAVNGSNSGVLMNNFTMIPEPATATLSLLALAGLAARRRRK
mgnify:CR=1 FL=1